MKLPAQFSLINSEFNAFLFASITDDGKEMPVSVLSALTRLGLDPWQEAARLADLPKDSAATALNDLLGRLPQAPSGTPEISARLVELLPRNQRANPIRFAMLPPGNRLTKRLFAAVCVLTLACIAAFLYA